MKDELNTIGITVYIPCDENDPDRIGDFLSADGQSMCRLKQVQLLDLNNPAKYAPETQSPCPDLEREKAKSEKLLQTLERLRTGIFESEGEINNLIDTTISNYKK